MEMISTYRLPAWTCGTEAYEQFSQIAGNAGQRIYLIGGARALQAGQGKLMAASVKSGISFAGIHTFTGICSMEAANDLARAALSQGADMICGMGGGRALDAAKAAGELADLPVFTFPTIAATCAAVTGLSVMYWEDGRFDRFFFLRQPPQHTFIDLDIIAHAPAMYLRAGMGDSLAKHVESSFCARGAVKSHADVLGLSVAQGLADTLFEEGAQAINDNVGAVSGEALSIIALQNIVSVGCVSLLVREEFNCSLAHSLYYALEGMKRISHCLHGDVVAWGSLVQLVMDEQMSKASKAMSLLRSIGTPCSLRDMGFDDVGEGALDPVVKAALCQPDMSFVPFEVTSPMVLDAVYRVEEMARVEVPCVC